MARDVCHVCAIVLVLLVETVMTQATAYVAPMLVAVSVIDVLMVFTDFRSIAGKETNFQSWGGCTHTCKPLSLSIPRSLRTLFQLRLQAVECF